ncbi:hypothetical protein [Streptomyces sp. NPDC056628]|uniref:hypothetical protein n=1 Tax=Streptomyces sp. NPDC056628 TaxID=3345882 RepID=UPI003680705C
MSPGWRPTNPASRAHAALTAALHQVGITAAAVEIHSDGEAAFASAPGGPADGIALLAGTGAVAVRVTGRTAPVGPPRPARR